MGFYFLGFSRLLPFPPHCVGWCCRNVWIEGYKYIGAKLEHNSTFWAPTSLSWEGLRPIHCTRRENKKGAPIFNLWQEHRLFHLHLEFEKKKRSLVVKCIHACVQPGAGEVLYLTPIFLLPQVITELLRWWHFGFCPYLFAGVTLSTSRCFFFIILF